MAKVRRRLISASKFDKRIPPDRNGCLPLSSCRPSSHGSTLLSPKCRLLYHVFPASPLSGRSRLPPLSGRSRPRALTSPKGGAALWAAKPKNKGLPIGSPLFLGQDVSDDKNSLRYIAPYTVYTIRGTIERLPPYFVSLSAIILRLFIRGCSCRRAS